MGDENLDQRVMDEVLKNVKAKLDLSENVIGMLEGIWMQKLNELKISRSNGKASNHPDLLRDLVAPTLTRTSTYPPIMSLPPTSRGFPTDQNASKEAEIVQLDGQLEEDESREDPLVVPVDVDQGCFEVNQQEVVQAEKAEVDILIGARPKEFKVRPQADGPNDDTDNESEKSVRTSDKSSRTSDSDNWDDFFGDSHPENSDEKEDDDDDDEEPIGSDDDDDDVDENADAFQVDNVILCQTESITRNRKKWKFVLKDGILNLDGRDIPFQQCDGEADWRLVE